MKVSPSGLLILIASIPDVSSSSLDPARVILSHKGSSNRDTSITNHRSPFLVISNNQEEENVSLEHQYDDASSQSQLESSTLVDIRGGAIEEESDYDFEDEEDDELEEESEEDEAPKKSLSKSTLSATHKIKTKISAEKTSKSKAAINASLQKTKKKKKRQKISLMKKLRIPYIIRACMNPLTVLSMTKSYFASLFNIAYLEEDSSQGLRSALEAKARKEAASGAKKGNSGGKKGKRAMKPGRAKTLSDLPQLSA